MIENLREIGNVLYRVGDDGMLYPVRRVRPDTVPQGVPPKSPGLLDIGNGVPEKLGLLNQMFNPVEAMGQSMQAGERLLSPGVGGWDRVAAAGDMLSGVAGVVAPVAAAKAVGTSGANALMEGLLGGSPAQQSATDMARQFAGDESGALRVFTGGTGDPIAAASDRGAWFSDVEDLASEYAGEAGRVGQYTIDPQRTIAFRHAEQRRPIGDVISAALEGAGDVDRDAAAQIGAILDRLYARYGDEPRALFEYWNKDKDVVDLFRALGYDAISAAEKQDMKAQTWGILDPKAILYDAAQ